ncbi:hypothetical protein JG688_00002901 [Phytophthora aleatoria]|uniref:WW domain-containing protein n=1 Tax=Phytophthora aleatoria TaxID=2496075 RepID=A0A8J5JAQ9_9STRA|nr:hypothetical protein JG688_00002901 [Phytophthora aleatoria]
MNSVVSPLRMNMTTTTGHPQAAPSSSSQPQRRHHRNRGGSSSMDMAQDPRFARMQAMTQMQMQQGYMGYAGEYPQQHQGMMKPQPQMRSTSSRQRAEAQRSNQPQPRQPRLHRSTTNEMVGKRAEFSQRDEELAGRPAMIAMSQDDLPFNVRRERPSGDRMENRSRHRRQPDEHRGNSKTGTFHGNCRGSRPAANASNSQSRQRSATTATGNNTAFDARKPEQVSRTQAPSRTSAPGTHDQAPVRTSAPGRAHAPVRTSAPTRSSVPEPVAWRVAVDPKSKKPYYYHPITRETTWKKPAELVAAETREKRQFFSVMENNIRLKLRDGYYTRDSETSNSSHSTPDAVHKPHEMSPHLSTRSSASTVSCNSARSSFNSFTSGSARSLPGSARQLLINSTRSLPTTPEGMGVPCMIPDENQPQQEPDTVERDSEDGVKRPSLFRTLSSYETPVMMSSRKGSDGIDVDEVGRGASTSLAVPSPIQERVRLAALAPRASDLEAYARAVRASNGKGRPSLQAMMAGRGSSASALMNTKGPRSKPSAVPADKPRALRRRSNSTNSIYLRMGTMNAPDQDATIQCVATVLRAHMMEALEDPIRSDPRFDVFVTTRDRQRLTSVADELDAEATTFVEVEDDDVMLDVVPTLSEIATFIKNVLSRAQMESECIIMSLVYVERLLKATSGFLQLRGENWRRLVFCSMVMASKVWDDLSMTNADFSKIWPELSLKQINELELVYLSAVEYNVRVSAVSYAKYYFHLRSMCATMGLLEAFDESAPLNLDGARKMQVLSEEYQERSKLMPVPRRRSVTITSTSAAESMQAGANAGRSAVGGAQSKSSKASPAASLEQLVHMQMRVAGGSSLVSMYRLSSNTVKQ